MLAALLGQKSELLLLQNVRKVTTLGVALPLDIFPDDPKHARSLREVRE